LRRFAGWCAGLVLVTVCGWGLLAFSLWLTQGSRQDMEVAGGLTALLSLGLFLLLERDLWLSRLMGLRIGPTSAAWKSALLDWGLGVPGLLFRSTQAEAAAAQPGTGAKTRRQPEAHAVDSVREVVETVVFVVVLVLMLKSFAAEAFVIPTGSMAQTLWGYQKVVTCPDCGEEFPVNCSSEVDPTDGRLEPIFGCICPNCRRRIHFPNAPLRYLDNFGTVEAADLARDRSDRSVEVPDPGWNSGDRVLVAKFVYDLLQRDPDRLDVVVFKFPGDQVSFPIESGPYKNNTPMNYIKRLIGLPGETIAIHGGKIYVLSAGKGLRYDDYDQAKNNPELFARLWQKEPFMHVNSEEAQQRWKQGEFRILRKPPEVLLAMMRLVYDNDHPPRNTNLPERWRGEGWQAKDRGFKAEGGREMAWLRYHHLPNRMKPDHEELITDFMAYNTYASGRHTPPGENWVGDLILECEVTLPQNPDKSSGEFVLELSRGVDRFQARWDLTSTDGRCFLVRIGKDGKATPLGNVPTGMTGKGTYKVRFANADRRLTVWVDGRLPFDDLNRPDGERYGVVYDAPREEGPTEKNDLEPASVGVSGTAVQVRKLRLSRDTYYTAHHHNPGLPDASFEAGNPTTWASLQVLPVTTLYVQPGHYLCMGDNSPESSDGRSWGTVPQRLLLGRAVMVYYPFGRAGRIR
jgi:signal peptidase I